MINYLKVVILAALFIVILGWIGEALGNWAGSDPGRIRTVLIVETVVLVGLLAYVVRIWRRRRSAMLDRFPP